MRLILALSSASLLLSCATGASQSDTVPPEATPGEMAMAAEAQEAKVEPKSTYNSVNVDGPYVAMTFDDGPSGKLTPKLLDLLKERGIKATFFVLGENVQEYPDIARRIVAEGHEIASHSWSHPSLPKLSLAGIRSQMQRTEDIIKEVTGRKVTLMRPPYGAISGVVRKVMDQDFNYKIIMWSVDPLDWKRPGVGVVANRIGSGAAPGAIILAHDIHPSTIAAMPQAFDMMRAKGLKFVTVSELLAMETAPRPAPTPKAAAPEPAAEQPAAAADPAAAGVVGATSRATGTRP